MEFSNTTTKDGILQDCEFWLFGSNYGQITGNTTLLNTFTALSNRALDSVTSSVLASDDRWNFDDTNYTNYPIGVTDLVQSQKDYVLSVSHLKITRVECMDAQGTWFLLRPIDLKDIKVARDEFAKSDGIPIYYDKLATSLFVYPASSYNSTGGLRVYYQREPSYFATTDTTKKPGFITLAHRLISLKACYDYSVANNLTDKITVLNNEIMKRELDLANAYSKRNKDEILTLKAYQTPSY